MRHVVIMAAAAAPGLLLAAAIRVASYFRHRHCAHCK